MTKCIFGCLGGRKSSRNQIKIPSKNQDHGVYEVVKPIKGIIVEEENSKEPIIDTQKKQEDHRDRVTKEEITCVFEVKNIESESSFKQKNNEKQEPEHNRSRVLQAHSDSSSMSSLFSYPISNRYKNNSSTGDESDTDDDHGFVQQQSSDSLFSISVNSNKQSEPGENEVNSPMKVCERPEKGKKKTRLNQNVLNLNVNPLVAKQEIEIIGSEYCVKINSITKPLENVTQTSMGKFGGSITVDEQEDKENIKSEQEMSIPFKQRLNFLDEIKIVGSNHGHEIGSLLNPIENLTRWNAGQSGRFKNMKFLERKAKEAIVVDTSLSSWLAESDRERDSPKSVKNSPDRGNNILGRYNNQNEKDVLMLTPKT